MKRFYLLFTISFAFVCQLSATTFTVTDTMDYGPGSLRTAIINANSSMGADMIVFNIPGMAPRTIQPLSPLPILTDAGTTIDGTTQPANGYAGHRRKIKIDGSLQGVGQLLEVDGSGFTLKGVELSMCPDFGIQFNSGASGFTLGGIGAGNTLVSASYFASVLVNGTSNGTVRGNIIGAPDLASIADSNNHGVILVGASNITIGGTVAGEGNVISGNVGNAIILDGSSNCTILGNIIGMDSTGLSAVPNGYTGISIENFSSGNQIGNATGGGNLISGNYLYGIQIICGSNNVVKGNKIGTDINGNGTFGNGFPNLIIQFHGNTPNCPVTGNVIGGIGSGEGNLIANGQFDGIQMFGANSNHNPIRGNSIYCNSSVAITLVYPFWNYPPGNDGYAAPVINSANSNGATGTAAANDFVDLYLDDQCTLCQPKTYVATVQADQAGNWSYSGPLNGNLTAIATNSTNNSSANSPCFAIPNIAVPVAAFTSSNPAFCEGLCTDFFDLTTGGPTSWDWTFPGGNPSSSTLQHPQGICYSAPGTYPVTLVATNLNGTDQLTMSGYISVHTNPIATAGPDQTICFGDSAQIMGQCNSGFQWGPTNGMTHVTSIHPMASPNSTTSYILMAQNANCNIQDTMTLFVNPLPVPTISQNGLVLTASGGVSFQWYFNGAPIFGAISQSYTVTATGNYAVSVTDSNGCTGPSSTLFVNLLSIGNSYGKLQVQLSPNPASSLCILEAHGLQEGGAVLVVFDQLGRPVLAGQLLVSAGKVSKELRLEGFATGIYKVVLKQGGMLTVRTLVVGR